MTSLGLGLGGSMSLLGLPGSNTYTFTPQYSADASDSFGASDSTTYNTRYYDQTDNFFRAVGTLANIKRVTPTVSAGIGIAPLVTHLPGVIMRETIGIQQSTGVALKYGWTASEQIYIEAALGAAIPRLVSEGIGIAGAFTLSLAITTLQELGIAPTPLPSMRYTQALAQTIGVVDSFRNFFGGELTETVGMIEALSKDYKGYPILADTVGILPVLAQKLYIRVTASDEINIEPEQALSAIYNGTLSDEFEITAGYVSPNGQFTTWAINTRTGAVSEYDNYAFNSFARIGNLYYGASSAGLYQLSGDTDDGADIVAQIKSGFAQWAGTKFTMFKAAYLGVRGGGDFVLKLTTGDGKTYNYAVSARDMRTTKINIGKGIRTRYFAFELISEGQDFDLDTIEFVPLVTDRRV